MLLGQTDLLSMIVGAVLGISCFIVLKTKHAHATWYRSNLPWGHVFCFIQMAYVLMMFPAVVTQAQWCDSPSLPPSSSIYTSGTSTFALVLSGQYTIIVLCRPVFLV
jgi:hypothetical protein